MSRPPHLARRFGPRSFASCVATAILVATLASGALTRDASGASSGRDGVPAFSHIFVVVMENLAYSEAVATPGLERLSAAWATATNYYGVSHPSLPNYLALSAGSTFSITSDCVACYVNSPNLFSELRAAHRSFDAFLEGVPTSCYLAPWGGQDYASKHNPFRYFLDVRTSPTLCAHLRSFTQLPTLLAGRAAAVPDFVWVTPNLCDDGHDCPSATAAQWLTGFVRDVTRSAAWRDNGALFVTWDEGDGDNSGVDASGKLTTSGGGGHVLTLVISPSLRRGLRISTPLNHYSLLATIEDSFGLPLLNHAWGVTTFSGFFTTSSRSSGA